jgi:sugar O-acyltransferase (sialic acid O-acetyltransferase NeuD family)
MLFLNFMIRLILIGGGGHCHACIDVIESTQFFEIVGIIDTKEKVGQFVLGYPIIGNDDDIRNYVDADTWFLVTVGQIQNANLRKISFERLESYQANIATIVSKNAIVSKHSSIGIGTIVMHNAIIGAEAKIGKNCIINTGADIEHDSTVGNNNHISTHAVVNGACVLGNDVFVGSNSTVFQGVHIVDKVVVSAGSII